MSEAMDKALSKDRDEWSVDYDAEPGIAGNAFERGWKAAQAVSLPDRETLAKVAGMIRRNCTPSTEAYQRGGDVLIYAVADWVENPPEWVLAAQPTKPAAAVTQDALDDLRESIEQELELGGDTSTLVPAVTEWLKRWPLAAPSTQPAAAPLSAEDRGVIIDALIQHRDHALARKAANPNSSSDVRADICKRLILSLGAPTQPAAGGAQLIAAERLRQVTEEGYTPEHDSGHAIELMRAGHAYITEARRGMPDATIIALSVPASWPWADRYWKPTGDPVRDLTKAGALIAAAIDSIRAEVQS